MIWLTADGNSFYSSVVGATIFTTITGFAWAITQWAPFTLVCLPRFMVLQLITSHVACLQLAEEILADDEDAEDASSILLDDTRSRRLSGPLEGQDDEP